MFYARKQRKLPFERRRDPSAQREQLIAFFEGSSGVGLVEFFRRRRTETWGDLRSVMPRMRGPAGYPTLHVNHCDAQGPGPPGRHSRLARRTLRDLPRRSWRRARVSRGARARVRGLALLLAANPRRGTEVLDALSGPPLIAGRFNASPCGPHRGFLLISAAHGRSKSCLGATIEGARKAGRRSGMGSPARYRVIDGGPAIEPTMPRARGWPRACAGRGDTKGELGKDECDVICHFPLTP